MVQLMNPAESKLITRETSSLEIVSGTHELAAKSFLDSANLNASYPSIGHVAEISQNFSNIPYENLSKIIKFSQSGGEISFRMPEEVIDDYSQWKLGGTCFSLTFYLMEILRFCGYECGPVMGDMNWGENTHSAVVLHFNSEKYLIDPGYMIHRPLLLSKDTVLRHTAPHAGIEIRFREEVGRYDLFTFRKGNYTWRYRFISEPVSLENFSRFWTESFFKPTLYGICLTKIDEQGMVYVHNNYTKLTNKTLSKRINDRNATEQIIREQFGIPMRFVEEARLSLEKIRKITLETDNHGTD